MNWNDKTNLLPFWSVQGALAQPRIPVGEGEIWMAFVMGIAFALVVLFAVLLVITAYRDSRSSPALQRLRRCMSNAWTAFAKSG